MKEYRELQKRLGLERVIVVQPNAYADDNTVTVNAIKELGKGAKGVAVVKPGVKDAELADLKQGRATNVPHPSGISTSGSTGA